MESPSHDGRKRILVLGYGNPGREDDGLGPAAAREIERMGWENVTVCDNYQLVIEDAADVAEADAVWFVDASRTGLEPFEIRPLWPAHTIEFTTHLVRPEVILALAKVYFGRSPEAYLLGIRGYQFEFHERLSDDAKENLKLAVDALAGRIREWEVASK
jgi:hydrogenase maturation protease